jgi:hypothetical protein
MRTRHLWFIFIVLLPMLLSFGCNGDNWFEDNDNDNDHLYRGSDTFFQRIYIGNVPIMEGETMNVPLAHVTRIRFELSREVTSYSLAQKFHFEIWVTNLDTMQAFRLTEANLLENGDLYWPDTTNKIVEYRLNHPMSYLLVGGAPVPFGDPGNTFKVNVIFLTGQARDGTQFALTDDEFFVVWTDSSQSL